jgi:predicted anti-sigma-YlaC factor YlaD
MPRSYDGEPIRPGGDIQVSVFDLLRKPWMATCRETGERLSDYLDEELRGRTLVRVRRHLARCERCQALLASVGRTIEELRSLRSDEMAPATDATVAAVLSRIDRDRS